MAVKKRLWYRHFPVNFAKFLWTLFLKNTSRQLLLLLAFQKQPLEVLYEKRCYWKFRKFTGKHLWFAKFPKTPFLRNLWTTASGFFTFFSCQFLKITKFLVFLNNKKTIFNDSFDLIIFIFQQGKSLMMEREFLAEVVEPTTGLMLSKVFIQMH